jgi:hypothetical protein
VQRQGPLEGRELEAARRACGGRRRVHQRAHQLLALAGPLEHLHRRGEPLDGRRVSPRSAAAAPGRRARGPSRAVAAAPGHAEQVLVRRGDAGVVAAPPRDRAGVRERGLGACEPPEALRGLPDREERGLRLAGAPEVGPREAASEREPHADDVRRRRRVRVAEGHERARVVLRGERGVRRVEPRAAGGVVRDPAPGGDVGGQALDVGPRGGSGERRLLRVCV